MMKRFIVMAEPNVPHGDGIRFIRDGFRPIAFVLPVVWQLWNRLWLQAAVTFAVMGFVAAVSNAFLPAMLPVISGLANFAIGLTTALEGPAWLAADLERKGHAVRDVLIAGSQAEAEEIFASRLPEVAAALKPAPRGFQPVSQASLIPLTGA
jgi:Protein of unknown function (DUF2628)